MFRASILLFSSCIFWKYARFCLSYYSASSLCLIASCYLALVLFLTALLMRVLVDAPSISSTFRLRKYCLSLAGELVVSLLMTASSAMVE